jgi:hypothetical protein
MKHLLAKTLAAAVVAGGLTLAPIAPARADSAGAAVAAGIGGFALGALAGGALAQPGPPPVYYGAPGYGPTPAYVGRPRRYQPVYEHCWRERRPVFDEYGEVIGYRPQRVCE